MDIYIHMDQIHIQTIKMNVNINIKDNNEFI